jgi:cytochrome bd-type quinol oxidase subunit 2
MRKLWALVLVVALGVAACSTNPEIIPDITDDSVIMLDIKSQIEHNKTVKDDYSWVIWYLPILFLVVAWGWKEFFGKKKGE